MLVLPKLVYPFIKKPINILMGHVLEIANKVHLERAGGNGEEHFRNILVISNSSEESTFRREAISRAD